jgi:hypothetical protein
MGRDIKVPRESTSLLNRSNRAYFAKNTLMNTAFRNGLTLLAATITLLGAPALRAQTLSFNVDINTATLDAQDGANAPFYIDFVMDYGNSSLASNTTTLSNFVLTGGTAGTATTSGGASGSIASTVSLTASSAHPASELYQEFSSGVTNISFTALVTETGPDPGAGKPTEFAATIFDSSVGAPAPIYTTAPDTASLLILNLSSSNTVSSVGAYTSVSSADGNTPVTGVTASITAIPEPSTTAAMFALCARRFGRLGAV